MGHCPACASGALAWTRLVPDREYALTRRATYACCAECRTLRQTPMPAENELGALYPPDYHSMGRGGGLARVRDNLRLRRLPTAGPARGALLDYGCGDGSFLAAAARSGVEGPLIGYEIGDLYEVTSRADGAVTIIRGTPQDLFAELPPCRLITMNHVIEHLPDPDSIVGRLTERLVPSGWLLGQTPNADSLEHRLFGPRWSGYHAPRHTVVFSERGLAMLVRRHGLVDVRIRAAFNPAALAVSIGSLGQRNEPSRLVRGGWRWLGLLLLASVAAPVDLLSGAPGVIDFAARKE